MVNVIVESWYFEYAVCTYYLRIFPYRQNIVIQAVHCFPFMQRNVHLFLYIGLFA